MKKQFALCSEILVFPKVFHTLPHVRQFRLFSTPHQYPNLLKIWYMSG